jgi:hypothetical protein
MHHVSADCVAYVSHNCIAHVIANCVAYVSANCIAHIIANCITDASAVFVAICPCAAIGAFGYQRLLFHELGQIPFWLDQLEKRCF